MEGTYSHPRIYSSAWGHRQKCLQRPVKNTTESNEKSKRQWRLVERMVKCRVSAWIKDVYIQTSNSVPSQLHMSAGYQVQTLHKWSAECDTENLPLTLYHFIAPATFNTLQININIYIFLNKRTISWLWWWLHKSIGANIGQHQEWSILLCENCLKIKVLIWNSFLPSLAKQTSPPACNPNL